MKKLLIMVAAVAGLASCGSCSGQGSASGNDNGTQEVPKVYMIRDISPESLMKIYKALGREAKGKVAVKIHMGEPGGTNYIKPALVGDFVKSIDGTFIDANTAYAGRRNTVADHMKAAEDHGFTAVGPVDILDADGDMALPIEGGTHLDEILVGDHFKDYDFLVVLTHFKGHAMGGFGGSIKNIAIGMASVQGKCLVHTAGASRTNAFEPVEQEHFLEAMAEGAKGIANYCGDNILYINVMNNLSVDCDCDNHPEPPRIADIGILASLDPVALDKACVDQVYASPEEERVHLVERMESRKGPHMLVHAEKIGLGSQKYELVMLDQ